MTEAEWMFFDRMPQLIPLYERLREILTARYDNLTIRVAKTQISFCNRHIFAMASLPYRRRKGWPSEFLLVSFGLSQPKDSPRIAQAVEAYPNRWTHHVLVQTPEEIDGELLNWIDEAYRFSLVK